MFNFKPEITWCRRHRGWMRATYAGTRPAPAYPVNTLISQLQGRGSAQPACHFAPPRRKHEAAKPRTQMEVASALVSVLFAAFSLPCLLLLVVVAEAAIRLAALAVRGDGYAWPSRSAFLGYRIARAGSFSYSSSSSAVSGGGSFPQDELLPPEFLDLLAVAVYRKAGTDAAVDCVFCLSRVHEGEEVRELRCRHVFHRECLDAWLLRPRATCPLCRDRLLPSEPPRACASAFDDDEIYVDEHEDLSLSSSSSSSSYAAGASYPHGTALWHM